MAVGNLKNNNKLPHETQIRQTKYLNNIIEQDHRFIKNERTQCLDLNHF
ncbi:hypothetical protein [Paenibacillus sp. SI8]